MPSLRFILRLDHGWLFVIAGLAMCGAAILVPARADLDQVRRQEIALRALVEHGQRRLDAREAFIDQLERGDPTLLRRLAAAQLNLVPAGSEPVLATSTRTATVVEWLDAAVAEPARPAEGAPTMLMRLTQGRRRPWFAGAAVLCLFVGLLSSIRTTRGH